jgi:hypothetical protein
MTSTRFIWTRLMILSEAARAGLIYIKAAWGGSSILEPNSDAMMRPSSALGKSSVSTYLGRELRPSPARRRA